MVALECAPRASQEGTRVRLLMSISVFSFVDIWLVCQSLVNWFGHLSFFSCRVMVDNIECNKSFMKRKFPPETCLFFEVYPFVQMTLWLKTRSPSTSIPLSLSLSLSRLLHTAAQGAVRLFRWWHREVDESVLSTRPDSEMYVIIFNSSDRSGKSTIAHYPNYDRLLALDLISD